MARARQGLLRLVAGAILVKLAAPLVDLLLPALLGLFLVTLALEQLSRRYGLD